MINGRERPHCPRCDAELCQYNSGVFCWPCTVPGYAWYWSKEIGDWLRIQVIAPEPEWKPEPGDIVLTEGFTPAPRKRDNWDKWRTGEPTHA